MILIKKLSFVMHRKERFRHSVGAFLTPRRNNNVDDNNNSSISTVYQSHSTNNTTMNGSATGVRKPDGTSLHPIHIVGMCFFVFFRVSNTKKQGS